MTTVAVASHKGGVGKTTVSLNLALSFARRGWRTLLVDADPQGAVGLSLQGGLAERPGLVDCLAGYFRLDDVAIDTRVAKLSVLPVGRTQAERVYSWERCLRDRGALARFFRRAGNEYEVVLIDTASGVYGTTREILRPIDHVLMPLAAEPLALRSTLGCFEALGKLRREGSQATVAGVVMTMVDSRQKVSLEVVQEVWKTLPRSLTLDVVIPRDEIFTWASAHGVPVALLSRRPPAVATVFDQLAAELEPRLELVSMDEIDSPIPLLD